MVVLLKGKEPFTAFKKLNFDHRIKRPQKNNKWIQHTKNKLVRSTISLDFRFYLLGANLKCTRNQ
jgi:hypothetical protein